MRPLAILIATFAAGCGGDPTPTPFDTKVNAATGGTVATGGATLAIPAGALDQDTTITVATSSRSTGLPDASTVTGLIYDFGPDGTTFDPPATLTLPMAGTPAANQRAVISFLDPVANQWVELGSTVTGGQISAPVAHFTVYAVRFVPLALTQVVREWWFEKVTAAEQVRITDPRSSVDLEVKDLYDFGPTLTSRRCGSS